MTSSCLKSPEEIFKEKLKVIWMDINSQKQALFNAIGELHANLDVSTENLPQFEVTSNYVQAGVELSAWLYNWREDFLPTKEERDEDRETQKGSPEN